MPSFNRTTQMGNLTRDVDVKTFNGFSVGNFTLAVNSKRKKGTEYVDRVDFFDCKVLGKTCENLAKYVRKGHPLFVDGHLEQETWEKDGQKRSKIVIVVDTFQFLASRSESQSHPHDDPNNWPGDPVGVGTDKGPPNDDDIPF